LGNKVVLETELITKLNPIQNPYVKLLKFGYALLWALGISTIATIVLQEMAARAGVVTRKGLAELIRAALPIPWFRKLMLAIMFSAIVIGNAAYEAGNLTGGVLGLQVIIPEEIVGKEIWLLLLGIMAAIILYIGSYKFLEQVLVVLVIIMSLSFLSTALASAPEWGAILGGLFTFQRPEGSLWLVLGLVGTTVVPYNLFLHASIVQKKWSSPADLPSVKFDTTTSILLGGLVSMAVLLCAIPLDPASLNNAGDLAVGFLNIKPLEIIQFAQIANGLLLPLIAGILLWVMNQDSLLGKYRNNFWQNLLGISVFLFACFLGVKGIWKVFG